MTGTSEEEERPRVDTLLQQTIQALDHARNVLARQASRDFVDQVWTAAFHLEYLTFLLSLARPQEEDEWKTWTPRERVGDVATILADVRDTLKDVVEETSKEGVYRTAWLTRGRLLWVQRRWEQRKAGSSQM